MTQLRVKCHFARFSQPHSRSAGYCRHRELLCQFGKFRIHRGLLVLFDLIEH